MKKLVAILALILHASLCAAQNYISSPNTEINSIYQSVYNNTGAPQYYIQSPNREIRVSFTSNRDRKGWSVFLVPTKMTMKVSNYTQDFVNREINLTVKSKGKRYSFGKSDMKNVNKVNGFVDAPDAIDSTLANLNGRYNTLTMASENGIILEVRAYNNGVAYRFRVSGYPEDYKILEQTNVFPGESPVAIVGTFEGEYVSPWHVLKIRVEEFNPETGKTPTNTISPTYHRGRTTVPWRDALSSVSIGMTFDSFYGDTWREMATPQSIVADFTYKAIYGGVSYTPCYTLLYIPWGNSYWPFEGVIADVDAWSLGAKAGYCYTYQKGYNVYNVIPYIHTSVMHLHQHRKLNKLNKSLDMHNHWLVGPGVKFQCAHRERLTLGVGVEYQFFTDKKAPDGKASLLLSIGKMF